jgi:hypothetical protein
MGALLAIVLFAATSARAADAPADFDFQNDLGRPGGGHLSPYAMNLELSGFDPWTGQPHGWTYQEDPHGLGGRIDRAGPVPADIVGRRAIPLPLGFAVGALLGVGLASAARRRAET